ncbi:hypothetical protein DH2020_010771 [Rehmannia glutinosa]|uniref:Rab-GAP TBC domain-containing protein n=1 Tax=Rehmannia glutinosa TaxID=99300 RepID=A0ABR0XBI7_REHGL
MSFSQPSFQHWFQEVLLNSPTDVANLFVVLCDLLWYNRNKCKFGDSCALSFSIVQTTSHILQDYHKIELRPDVPLSPLLNSTSLTRNLDGVRIQFDGALSLATEVAGVGVAVFDASGSFLQGFSKRFMRIKEPEVIEFLALRKALKFSRRLEPYSFFFLEIVLRDPTANGEAIRKETTQALSLSSTHSTHTVVAMHEPELHDLSDDADYAASIQQGSESMIRSDSRKRSSSNEPEGAEIVYTKDNVTIHPSQYASERISGRLKLIKQGNSLFMLRPVSLSGLAFPPLYFYNGGVREFLATIKQHVFLVRSAEDSNVFLVNDFQNPLQRTLSSLELPRAVSVANVPSPTIGANKSPSSADQEKGESDNNTGNFQQNGRQRQKHHDPARDLSIQVLEKFSLVTRFARETTSQLFRESHLDGFTPNDAKHGQLSPVYNHITASNDSPKVPDEVSVPSDPVEFDKLSLVWGKPRQPPLGPEEWATFLDAEGRVMDSKALIKRIFYGGVEHDLRKEIWTFLLGFHTYDSTYAERDYLMSVKKSEYETIKKQWQWTYIIRYNVNSLLRAYLRSRQKDLQNSERKGLIDKDVVRTDRSLLFYDGDDNPNVYLLRDILLTYSFYNFDLGEFEYDKTMRMWEVLWTHYLSEHLHLYVCVAILKRYRNKIIGEQMDFDTLLKFINELSGQIDLDATLREAEALCICAGENGAACIPPGTPPSLPIEDASLYPQQDDDVL